MAHLSLFPLVENLLKEKVALYGFVPPDVQPPYVIYEVIDQRWNFPEDTKGTITFFLKAVSLYKGAQEINQMGVFLKEKLEGVEVDLKPEGKGIFRFIDQREDLKKEGLRREIFLKFQLFVKGFGAIET